MKNISKSPVYSCNPDIINTLSIFKEPTDRCPPKVAVIREEGSNGDSEMRAAFKLAGFDTWDVNTLDLNNDASLLDTFQGVAFVGGFSFSDVFGAAKGWSATIKFNKNARKFAVENTHILM